MRLAFPSLVLAACAAGLAGCTGAQSVLDTFGPQAAELSGLFWTFTIILAGVWLLTMAALIAALFVRRAPQAHDPQTMVKLTGGPVLATAVVLLLLTALSYRAQSHLYSNDGDAALSIHVTGHQWWWEVRYDDSQPAKIFTTANEIHLPAGRLVEITLSTADVIHSFWVPGLFGKMDLINGVENKIRFAASRIGSLRGQCAEFCGLQHAHMALSVVIESPADFARWQAAQLSPAGIPHSSQGEQIFLSKPCISCHSVRGSPAGGRVGPDLTHLASRPTLAAGTLPMTRGALAAWIVDPQAIKPGTNMPAVPLEPRELHPLLDYLDGLQ